MTDSLQATEDYSAARSTHPRVSLDDIKNAIVAEYTTTLDRAHAGSPTHDSMKLVTIHTVVMRNGFVVIGKSAPASPENFDPDKGFVFAREDAIRQIWPLMGYALKDRLAA